MSKIVASSKDRYRASAAERRQYGGATVTEFYVYRAEDAKDASKWKIVRGYGKTPGDRKTDAIRRSGFLEEPARDRGKRRPFMVYLGRNPQGIPALWVSPEGVHPRIAVVRTVHKPPQHVVLKGGAGGWIREGLPHASAKEAIRAARRLAGVRQASVRSRDAGMKAQRRFEKRTDRSYKNVRFNLLKPWTWLVQKPKSKKSSRDPADPLTFNTQLAKVLSRLKKDASATTIRQNYRGTGSKIFRRQLYVSFKSGALIDLWLERDRLGLGGIVTNGPIGEGRIPLSKRAIPYGDKSPEEVYEDALEVLKPWANPSARDKSRRSARLSRDPAEENARGTVIVKMAAKKTRGAREMLLVDRDRKWRDLAIAHLHRTAQEAKSKGLSESEVNKAIATMIAYQATEALAKRAR